MVERLLVLGGDPAGVAAATTVRRLRGDVEIVVAESGNHTDWAGEGVPQLVGGLVDGLERLSGLRPSDLRDRLRIDIRCGHSASGIDLLNREVEIDDDEHERTYRLRFDRLLLAGWGRTPVPATLADAPVIDPSRPEDALALTMGLAGGARHAVVVGAGLPGLELAEALAQRGVRVTIVDPAAHLLDDFDADLVKPVSRALEQQGIGVQVSAEIRGWEEGRVATDRGLLPEGLVVAGAYPMPANQVAGDAGVVLGPTGGAVVDARFRTSAEGVWAVGRAAEVRHRLSSAPLVAGAGLVAGHGQAAGTEIAGGYQRVPWPLDLQAGRVGGYDVARVGLTAGQAEGAGYEVRTSTVAGSARAAWYPGARPLQVRLVAERGSGLILGVQAVGVEGAVRAAETVTLAIDQQVDVGSLARLETPGDPALGARPDPLRAAAIELATT
ncbi:MAG: FAD-dependent oxidoreductase [Actinomycetia bacterium]|nr:FAD-dependent oxidoreductase [Actinomycetes bacterium]MCP4083923.1 FAD-dependent oxidoreductase [Actinomycetes bacterium]